MSKRKVHFASTSEEVIEEALFEAESGQKGEKLLKLENQHANYDNEPNTSKNAASKVKNAHTLDSDEEVDEDKYNVLEDDDIEGQEDHSNFNEEEGRFTSFNMKEELEEGHFDKQGTYIFDKDNTKIVDNWMDNVDWVQVKHKQGYDEAKDNDDSSDDEDDDKEPAVTIDKVESYRMILKFMKPNETILKSLRRLGGGKSAPSRKWQKSTKSSNSGASPHLDKASLDELTGLANTLLQNGDYEIYQCTYEKLSHRVKVADDDKVKIPEGIDEDDALDMFANSIDTKQSQDVTKKSASSGSQKVEWQYKWKDDDKEVHGPYSSAQMFQWMDSGFFDGKPILVRKTLSKDGEFYDGSRIDFELYT